MASARNTGTSESVSLYDSAGGSPTPDYTSLSTWEAATDTDLVTANDNPVLEVRNGPHAQTINIGGATANATWFRIIRPTSGAVHSGTEATAVKFTGTTHVLRANENGVQVQDVAAQVTANTGGNRFGIWWQKADTKVIGCFSHDAVNSGAGVAHGFSLASDATIRLCEGVRADENNFDLTNTLTQNCTAYGGTNGFVAGGGSGVVTNCISTFTTGDDFSGSVGPTFSMSGDATATGTGSVAYSDDNAFTFVNVATDDYHLDGLDTGAQDLGTDLSGTFDDDIDFDIVISWSAGHDAQVAAAAAGGSVWPSPTNQMAHLLNR